jgi:hypothetical protein
MSLTSGPLTTPTIGTGGWLALGYLWQGGDLSKASLAQQQVAVENVIVRAARVQTPCVTPLAASVVAMARVIDNWISMI